MSNYAWVLTEDVEYEGCTVMGVFDTRIQAQRAIDKSDPPPSKAKRWEWRVGKYGSWRPTGVSNGVHYGVERFKKGQIGN